MTVEPTASNDLEQRNQQLRRNRPSSDTRQERSRPPRESRNNDCIVEDNLVEAVSVDFAANKNKNWSPLQYWLDITLFVMNAAVTIFGMGVGVGLILGDSFRSSRRISSMDDVMEGSEPSTDALSISVNSQDSIQHLHSRVSMVQPQTLPAQ